MSYPHLYNDFEDNQSVRSGSDSPFDVPMDLLKRELVWLLADPACRALEETMREDHQDVEELRAAILINADKFSSQSMNHILDEIDRVVDEYRNKVALL